LALDIIVQHPIVAGAVEARQGLCSVLTDTMFFTSFLLLVPEAALPPNSAISVFAPPPASAQTSSTH
jgi:hypothetical protein